MGHSYAYLPHHIIFSTKERARAILPEFRTELLDYIAGILRKRRCRPIAINAVPDHVHILTSLHRSISVSSIVRDIKSNSSGWVHSDIGMSKFAWQEGYAAFAVGRTEVARIEKYIAIQEEHHRRKSYKEEVRGFLRAYGIEFDEKDLWD